MERDEPTTTRAGSGSTLGRAPSSNGPGGPDESGEAGPEQAAVASRRAATNPRLRDREQPVSAAARFRRSGHRRAERQPQTARHDPAAGRPPHRRALSTHRRRAASAGRDQGRLAAGPGTDSRRRRPADVRSRDRREPAAQGPECLGKGALLPAIPGTLRLHARGTGRPIEDRSLDDRQPDPAVGTARGDPAVHSHRRPEPGTRPGPVAVGRRARAIGLLPADSG